MRSPGARAPAARAPSAPPTPPTTARGRPPRAPARRATSGVPAASLTAALAAALATVTACGREPPGERLFAEPPRPPLDEATAARHAYSTHARFDASGALLEGTEKVAGFALPRGAEKILDLDRRHVYAVRAPIDKVTAYVGPRLVTGRVRRMGEGTKYEQAEVRGAVGSSVRLEVTLAPAGPGVVHIDIIELPPPPARPLTEAEVRLLLEREERERPSQ
jgi:hypothetical protein